MLRIPQWHIYIVEFIKRFRFVNIEMLIISFPIWFIDKVPMYVVYK